MVDKFAVVSKKDAAKAGFMDEVVKVNELLLHITQNVQV